MNEMIFKIKIIYNIMLICAKKREIEKNENDENSIFYFINYYLIIITKNK